MCGRAEALGLTDPRFLMSLMHACGPAPPPTQLLDSYLNSVGFQDPSNKSHLRQKLV